MWHNLRKSLGAATIGFAAAGLIATTAVAQDRNVETKRVETPDGAGKSFEDQKDFLKYYNEVWNDWQHERNQSMTRSAPPGRYKTDDNPDPTAWEEMDAAEIRALEYQRRIHDRELRDPDMRASDDYRDRYLGSVIYWTEANNYWTGPVRSPNKEKMAEAEEHTERIGKGPADEEPAKGEMDEFSDLDRNWRQSDYQWRLTDYYWADPDLRDDPGYKEYWEMSDRYWTDSDAYWYHANRSRGIELPEGEDEYIASRTNQGKGVQPEDEN